MKTLMILATRNIKLFLRDRLSVFFSFLSAMIIIMLYALFLKNNMVSGVSQDVGAEYASWFVDSWLMAGIIVVNSITVSLGILGLMITDQTDNRLRSFLIAPIKRSTIVSGYLVSAWIIGFVLIFMTFILGEIYIKLNGGALLSIPSMLAVTGLIMLNVFTNTSIIFCIVTFLKTEGSFRTLSTILGTIIGFITGIYMPIGFLSDSIQTFTKFVPATYGVTLMRQVFMHEPVKLMFEGAPQTAVLGFEKFFGSQVFWGDYQCTPLMMILILLASGFLAMGGSILNVNRKKR